MRVVAASDRLQNAFTMLAIILVVGRPNIGWLPFPEAIPWGRILVVVEQQDFDRGPSAAILNATRRLSPAQRHRRRRLMRAHLPDLLWTVKHSRAATNFLRAVGRADQAGCRSV